MPKRDVFHFSPDPVGDALSHLLYHFTVDSNDLGPLDQSMNPYTYGQIKESQREAESKLQGVAVLKVDKFRSFHVTDDPSIVMDALQKGLDLAEQRPSYGDLCGGLYVSLASGLWKGRSKRKWDFLNELGPGAKETLYQGIREELVREVTAAYITQSEYNNAMDQISDWLNEKGTYGLILVANQPYNIDVQKLARKVDIASPFEPYVVEVKFEGRYLDLTDQEAREETAYLASHVLGREEGELRQYQVCKVLREKGWDGAFTRTTFSLNPELVIWNGEKILNFGGWTRG